VVENPDHFVEKKMSKAILVGIAGSYNAFSLSLYNIKAFAYNDPEIRDKWDLSVIQHRFINLSRKDVEVPRLIDQIVEANPDLVAFSCYMWNVNIYNEIARALRKRTPNTKIIWGGPEMSSDYLLQGKFDNFEMDYCVYGEGEKTFLEFLKNQISGVPALPNIPGLAYRDNPTKPFKINSKREPMESLDEVPSPFLTGAVDDEVLLRSKIEGNIETQRGCNLRCSYCIYHKDMDRITYSSVDRVVAETRYLVNKGVKRIMFVDANFSSDLDYAKTIIRAFIQQKFELRLMFELIPGFIDEELATLFEEFSSIYPWNDITLGVGVQSTNLETLKNLRRGIKIDKFNYTFDLIKKHNLMAKIDLIIGLPGENISHIEASLEFMMDTMGFGREHLLCIHVMRALPGTELVEIGEKNNMTFSSKYEPHEFIESPDLPRKDMLKCLRRTAVIFRLTNTRSWVGREFVSGKKSEDVTIREAFFNARERLDLTNIELVDLIVEGLMDHLKARNSRFVQPDFPNAEDWWWNLSAFEVTNEWLLEYLANLEPCTV
jgi:anaerobic magnesium-protoporphyrin IX monomethyl ester cyclase